MDIASAGKKSTSRRWFIHLPEGLPDFTGKWLTLYVMAWAIMLPLAILGPVRTAYFFYGTHLAPAWLPYGVIVRTESETVRLAGISSTEARQAGVTVGDRVVAIDGWKIPASSAGFAMARHHLIKPEGASTTFSLATAREAPRNVRLTFSKTNIVDRYRGTGMTFDDEAWLYIGGTLLTCLALVGAAILLVMRRRREAIPALISLSFLMLSAAQFADWRDVGVSLTITVLVATTGWWLLLVSLLAFPTGRFAPPWTRIAALLSPLLIVEVVVTQSDSLRLWSLAVVMIAAVASLITRYRSLEAGREFQQLRWVFFGFVGGAMAWLLCIGGTLLAYVLIPVDPRWDVWSTAILELATLGVLLFTFGLIVAILRYRLYDADAVIGRSAAYAVLTLGFVMLFAASEKLIELGGQAYLGQNIGGLAGGVAAALAAVAIAPMHSRIHQWAERKFQKPLYRLRHSLPALVNDLRETSGVDRIAAATLDSIVEGVRARSAALLVGDQLIDARQIDKSDVEQWRAGWKPPSHDGIDFDKSDRLFPVRMPLEAEGHGRAGWLLLGPRPDGSLFGRSEREVIEDIAEPVARAIQVATSREQREERYELRFAKLELLVRQLKARPSAA